MSRTRITPYTPFFIFRFKREVLPFDTTEYELESLSELIFWDYKTHLDTYYYSVIVVGCNKKRVIEIMQQFNGYRLRQLDSETAHTIIKMFSII